VSSGLESRFRELAVAPGTLGCVWLGQAGYLLKSPGGAIIALDPYLSGYAEQQWNLPRILPPPIDPAKLAPDLLLCSHWHEDHFDFPVVKQWARQNPGTFAAPSTCTSRAGAFGWPAEKVIPVIAGSRFRFQDVEIAAHFARHEVPHSPAPDAVSYVFRIDGLTLWAICDTEYDARLRAMAHEGIDIVFTPINGVGGNLTDKEAALLLSYVKPKLAIPNHYNMWEPAGFGPGATLDPNGFVEAYRLLGGGETRILPVGEIVTLRC
jgi:L-ascorbate 6-phosphate lactonase